MPEGQEARGRRRTFSGGAGSGPRCLGGKRARDEPARQCFGGGVVREDH